MEEAERASELASKPAISQQPAGGKASGGEILRASAARWLVRYDTSLPEARVLNVVYENTSWAGHWVARAKKGGGGWGFAPTSAEKVTG